MQYHISYELLTSHILRTYFLNTLGYKTLINRLRMIKVVLKFLIDTFCF